MLSGESLVNVNFEWDVPTYLFIVLTLSFG